MEFFPVHSVQTLNRMDVVHPHWWGLSAVFSTLIQMLIPPRNTLPDTLRIMFNWIFGHMFNCISGHSMAQSSSHVNVTVVPWMEHYTNWQKTGYCLCTEKTHSRNEAAFQWPRLTYLLLRPVFTAGTESPVLWNPSWALMNGHALHFLSPNAASLLRSCGSCNLCIS